MAKKSLREIQEMLGGYGYETQNKEVNKKYRSAIDGRKINETKKRASVTISPSSPSPTATTTTIKKPQLNQSAKSSVVGKTQLKAQPKEQPKAKTWVQELEDNGSYYNKSAINKPQPAKVVPPKVQDAKLEGPKDNHHWWQKVKDTASSINTKAKIALTNFVRPIADPIDRFVEDVFIADAKRKGYQKTDTEYSRAKAEGKSNKEVKEARARDIEKVTHSYTGRLPQSELTKGEKATAEISKGAGDLTSMILLSKALGLTGGSGVAEAIRAYGDGGNLKDVIKSGAKGVAFGKVMGVGEKAAGGILGKAIGKAGLGESKVASAIKKVASSSAGLGSGSYGESLTNNAISSPDEDLSYDEMNKRALGSAIFGLLTGIAGEGLKGYKSIKDYRTSDEFKLNKLAKEIKSAKPNFETPQSLSGEMVKENLSPKRKIGDTSYTLNKPLFSEVRGSKDVKPSTLEGKTTLKSPYGEARANYENALGDVFGDNKYLTKTELNRGQRKSGNYLFDLIDKMEDAKRGNELLSGVKDTASMKLRAGLGSDNAYNTLKGLLAENPELTPIKAVRPQSKYSVNDYASAFDEMQGITSKKASDKVLKDTDIFDLFNEIQGGKSRGRVLGRDLGRVPSNIKENAPIPNFEAPVFEPSNANSIPTEPMTAGATQPMTATPLKPIKLKNEPVGDIMGEPTYSDVANATYKSPGAVKTLNRASKMANQLGEVQEGTLPKSPSLGGELKERAFPQSVAKANLTDLELKKKIGQGDIMYESISNPETLAEANRKVNKDVNSAYNEVMGEGTPTAQTFTMAQVIMNRLQKEGRYDEVVKMLENVSGKATNLGQAIQSLSLWSRMKADGMSLYAQSLYDKINKEYPRLNLKMTSELAEYINVQMNKIQEMPEGRKKTLEMAKVIKRIMDPIPAETGEKISTIQTMAQLLRPKTWVRNVGSNIGFGTVDTATSDVLGTGIDALLGVATGKRTKSLPNLGVMLNGAIRGGKEALEDIHYGVDTLNTKTKYDLPDKQVFKGRIGKGLQKLLDVGLKVSDRAQYQAFFDNSLYNQMKRAKVTVPTKEMIEQANYEGLYKTFQDDNAASVGFSKLKGGLNTLSSMVTGTEKWGLGDMVLKYPKTNGSLLMRSIEYSPAGLLKTLVQIGVHAKKTGAFDQKAFSEGLARAGVGTMGLIGSGMFLNKIGVLTGPDSKDPEAKSFLKDSGLGGYRINASAVNRIIQNWSTEEKYTKRQDNDTLVSYDWAQPLAMSLAIGANIQQSNGNKAVIDSMGDLATAQGLINFGNALYENSDSAVEVMGDQSVYRNIRDDIKYSNSDYDMYANILGEVPTSFIPGILQDTRNLYDNNYRVTEGDTFEETVKNKILNKLPGYSKNLPAQVNTMGQDMEMYQDGSNTFGNVFLKPYFESKYNPTPERRKLIDLFERTGDANIFPKKAEKSISSDGTTLPLSPKDRATLQKIMAFNVRNGIRSINETDDSKTIDAIKDMLSQAGASARDDMKEMKGLLTSSEVRKKSAKKAAATRKANKQNGKPNYGF